MSEKKKKELIENYEKLINDAFIRKGIIEKNHDYFSRIRGQIRAITDTKEEYKALRDDIFSGYDQYRKTNQSDYIIRGNEMDENGKRVKPLSPSDRILHNDDGEAVFSIFSRGCVRDFSKKQSCFVDGTSNLKKMDNRQIKYTWTLGKDGLMLIKYKMMDTPFNERPQNKEGHQITNSLISRAEDSAYWELNSRFYKAHKNELKEITHKFGEGKITYDEANAQESLLFNKYVKNNMSDCIDNLNTHLIGNNLVNQKTGEPLFEIGFAKSGK